MSTILHLPRMSQRVRAWANTAADRAGEPEADTSRWHSIAARLHHAADLYERCRDDEAAAVVDDVMGRLLHSEAVA